MILCEELYFEITLTGIKSELKKFISCLKSGELDDFFEFSSDYISYDDEYADAGDGDETSIVFTNDDLGIEIDEEACLAHPYKVHTLRHYTGALTDIRPPKSEFYF